MVILGLGGLLGDAACAVLKDGELKAAIEENKLDHVWRPGGLPQASIAGCLRLAGATRDEVECVAVVRPFARAPESQMHSVLRDQFPKAEIAVVEHHQAHAASAFFASPFEEATVLTLDHEGISAVERAGTARTHRFRRSASGIIPIRWAGCMALSPSC